VRCLPCLLLVSAILGGQSFSTPFSGDFSEPEIGLRDGAFPASHLSLRQNRIADFGSPIAWLRPQDRAQRQSLTGAAAVTNLVVNPEFEQGPFDPDPISGWDVTGSVTAAEEGATSPTHSAALNVGSDSEGNVLSQALTTVTGQDYTIDFDAGIFGVRSGQPLQLRIRVFDTTTSNVLVDQTIAPPDALTFSPDQVSFQHYQFAFTAADISTTIEFSDIGTGNQQADTLVDTVSVIAVAPSPTPTPGTLPLSNASF
jgi:hypothetical protein